MPDTFDGRFDVLVLHAALVLVELDIRDEHILAQELVDALFARLDEALREQGVGDMGLARRMKSIMSAFYGRVHTYRDAKDETELAGALLRNVFRGTSERVEQGARVEQAARLARYVLDARRALATSRVAEGELEFGSIGQSKQ